MDNELKIGNVPEPTIPEDIRNELKEDAKRTSRLGESVSGEPLLFVPGTRAWKAFKELVSKGYDFIVKAGRNNPIE